MTLVALKAVQEKFISLVETVHEDLRPAFLQWIQSYSEDLLNDSEVSNADAMLNQIRDDLREIVPVSACLPSEHIQCPTNEEWDAASTVHVDGFLYDDRLMDELCEERKMSRHYCTDCLSHNVQPLTFMSHSTSVTQLKYIFKFLVPSLQGKTVLDIGSRLGAVLYGAYVYSSCNEIVGVEMNKDLCDIQSSLVQRYKMDDRIKIVCADVTACGDNVGQADIILMNNVFEFFASVDVQERTWQFLRQSVTRQGTLLVVSPSLQKSVQHFQSIDVKSWVREVDVTDARKQACLFLFGSETNEDIDLADIHVYSVL